MVRRPLTGLLSQYSKNAGGAAASGYFLKLYKDGTTTPISLYTLQTGGVALDKCKLNTRGEPINNASNDDSTFIPYVDEDYDAYLFFTEADADSNNTVNSIFLGQNIQGDLITEAELPDYVAAEFADVANMKAGTALNFANTVDFADYVGRRVCVSDNNSTSKKGSADYKIKTAAQVTADGDTIDGDRNHWLLGGTDYAAILLESRTFFTRGAIADGATDQGALLESQLLLDKSIDLERGNFAVQSVSLSSDNLIIRGEGNQISRLTPTAVSPSYSISLTNDYTHFQDMRIGAGGTNMIAQSGNSYYNYFNNVWFGPSDVAIDVSSDFYWSNFVACHFRDNERAITCDTGQDFNAVTFLGGSFYHFDAANAGPSVDVFGGDGVCFMGSHVQNQGMKFDTMDGVEIAGGYWECYDVPTIEAINSQISISGGMYFPNASRFKFDPTSIKKLNGFGPNLFAKDSEGIDTADNTSQRIAPVQKDIKNLFDDGSCSTQKAIDALAYSPTGLAAARVINGSNNVEISFSSATHRAACRLPNAQGISIYVKWRATAGTGRLSLQNTVDNMSLIHDSTTDSEWRHCHWHALQSGANPAIVFDPQSDTSTVIEVDTIIISDQFAFIQAESQSYQLPSGQVTMPSAATVSVSFPQPPTGNYRIFLQGDTNETFWYSAKTTTGFTINSSNASSTANVYWEVRLG